MGTRTVRAEDARREAERILRREVASAWLEYLTHTRLTSEANYVEVESWAWSRLQARLRATAARLNRLAS